MVRQRLEAAQEIGVLFALWTFTVWGAWRWTGVTVWTAAGFTALAVAWLRFVFTRRLDLKRAGLRLDNLARALLLVAVVAGFLLSISLVLSPSALAFPPPFSASLALQLIASGILQQAFFLGYLLQRWRVLVQCPILAVLLNALFFAYVHLPNPSLVIVTLFAGVLFGLLFLQVPNVLAVGLAHGVLALLAGPLLESHGLLQTRRIGPAELAPFAEQIGAEWRPGDRIGVGPRGVGAELFGRRFQVPVEFIGDPNADDSFNRDRLGLLLRSKETVFCVLTLDDFQRYVESGQGREIVVLRERFILRRKFHGPDEILRKLIDGDGDTPVLALFRERVLLVTNRHR